MKHYLYHMLTKIHDPKNWKYKFDINKNTRISALDNVFQITLNEQSQAKLFHFVYVYTEIRNEGQASLQRHIITYII